MRTLNRSFCAVLVMRMSRTCFLLPPTELSAAAGAAGAGAVPNLQYETLVD